MTGRRVAAVLLVVAVLGLVACGVQKNTSAPRSTTSGVSTTQASTSTPAATSAPTPAPTSTSTTIPQTTPYQPLAAEPEAALKSEAARFTEALGTFGSGGGSAQATAARLVAAGFDKALGARAPAITTGAERSKAEIVYPQLGGLTGDNASVMVIVDLTRTMPGGETEQISRTIDVRLRRMAGVWTVIDVASEGGIAPASATPDALATQVLRSANLSMSDSARWDVAVGRVDPRILRLVLDLAERSPLGITVFATGHPVNVFGESSVSNHTRGRGVDIWSVGGKPVVGADQKGSAHDVAAAALAAGATELGAPWDLDGTGGPSFTNALHADHLHVAFDR